MLEIKMLVRLPGETAHREVTVTLGPEASQNFSHDLHERKMLAETIGKTLAKTLVDFITENEPHPSSN